VITALSAGSCKSGRVTVYHRGDRRRRGVDGVCAAGGQPRSLL